MIQSQSSGPCNPPPTCNRADRLPDPEDCTKFYRCDNNNTWISRSCPGKNQNFNSNNNRCTAGRNFKCADPCPGRVQVPTPSGVNTNSGWIFEVADCYADSRSCNVTAETNYGYIGDPSDCSKYYVCDPATGWIPKQCPNGNTEFDIRSRNCVPQNQGTCQQGCPGGTRLKPPATTTPPLIQYSRNYVCNRPVPCTLLNQAKIPDPEDCQYFYECNSNTGQWEKDFCPGQQKFNNQTFECRLRVLRTTLSCEPTCTQSSTTTAAVTPTSTIQGQTSTTQSSSTTSPSITTTTITTTSSPSLTTTTTTTVATPMVTGTNLSPAGWGDMDDRVCSLMPSQQCNINDPVLADPIDCSKFYSCYNGEYQNQPCTLGYLFDTVKGACQIPSQAYCHPQCTTATGGVSTTADSTSTTSTTVTAPDTTTTITSTSPQPETTTTEPQTTTTTTPVPLTTSTIPTTSTQTPITTTQGNLPGQNIERDLVCQSKAGNLCYLTKTTLGNERILPDPDSCSHYYQCDMGNGQWRRIQCKGNKTFNRLTLECENSRGSQSNCEKPCSQHETLPPPAGWVARDDAVCSFDSTQPCRKNSDPVPDPEDCSFQFACLNGQYMHGPCRSGMLFDAREKKCKRPSQAYCHPSCTTVAPVTTNTPTTESSTSTPTSNPSSTTEMPRTTTQFTRSTDSASTTSEPGTTSSDQKDFTKSLPPFHDPPDKSEAGTLPRPTPTVPECSDLQSSIPEPSFGTSSNLAGDSALTINPSSAYVTPSDNVISIFATPSSDSMWLGASNAVYKSQNVSVVLQSDISQISNLNETHTSPQASSMVDLPGFATSIPMIQSTEPTYIDTTIDMSGHGTMMPQSSNTDHILASSSSHGETTPYSLEPSTYTAGIITGQTSVMETSQGATTEFITTSPLVESTTPETIIPGDQSAVTKITNSNSIVEVDNTVSSLLQTEPTTEADLSATEGDLTGSTLQYTESTVYTTVTVEPTETVSDITESTTNLPSTKDITLGTVEPTEGSSSFTSLGTEVTSSETLSSSPDFFTATEHISTEYTTFSTLDIGSTSSSFDDQYTMTTDLTSSTEFPTTDTESNTTLALDGVTNESTTDGTLSDLNDTITESTHSMPTNSDDLNVTLTTPTNQSNRTLASASTLSGGVLANESTTEHMSSTVVTEPIVSSTTTIRNGLTTEGRF